MKKFIFKLIFLVAVLSAIMLRIEWIDVWDIPANNEQYMHARWNSLYELTEKHEIDILLMGNSRIYNGINPAMLSAATSSLSFILGAPGTTLHENYFSFKEVLKRAKPKLLVIETFCINGFENNPNNVAITYFKSFNARKDIESKLLSMPGLFHFNHWPYAWMSSIRNHNYIFDESQDLKKNIGEREKIQEMITRGKDNMYMGKYSLYLGKFNGNNGLKQDVLDRYDQEGPPADAADFAISELNIEYLEKLDKLCRKHNVELIFLTVPVYHKHIKNYEQYKEKLGQALLPFGRKWLDLQGDYDTTYFRPEHFDNTYESNQHTTGAGSLACTRRLIDFIKTVHPGIVPDRSSEAEWNNLFYGSEEYFVHHSLKDGDKTNQILFKNAAIGNATITECGYAEIYKKGFIWTKILPSSSDARSYITSKTLRIIAVEESNQTNTNLAIDLRIHPYYSDKDYLIFAGIVKPLKLKQVLQVSFH